MRNNKNTKGSLQDSLIVLGIILLLLWFCRLWPLMILLFFIVGIVAFIRLLPAYSRAIDEANAVEPEMEDLSEIEVEKDRYALLVGRITDLVNTQYPNAKWVWERADARRKIELGEDVHILLNQAGGYRKARVQVRDYQVESIDFLTVEQKEKPQADADEKATESGESEPVKKNYELLAYEWVADRIILLNERCNDAIGRGDKELILTESELPQEKESWADICRELERAELKNVELTPQGIKITLSVEETEKE